MRRNNGRDSCARFFPESFPRLHFSGLYICPRDLHRFQGLRAPSDGSYIYRPAVCRPANDVVARFEPRYGMNPAAFERPDSPFSIGSAHHHALTIRRDGYAGDALGSDGLGIATAQINQVVAPTVRGLNSRGQQPLAVRQKPNFAVAYGIVCELPCLARSRWDQAQ